MFTYSCLLRTSFLSISLLFLFLYFLLRFRGSLDLVFFLSTMMADSSIQVLPHIKPIPSFSRLIDVRPPRFQSLHFSSFVLPPSPLRRASGLSRRFETRDLSVSPGEKRQPDPLVCKGLRRSTHQRDLAASVEPTAVFTCARDWLFVSLFSCQSCPHPKLPGLSVRSRPRRTLETHVNRMV